MKVTVKNRQCQLSGVLSFLTRGGIRAHGFGIKTYPLFKTSAQYRQADDGMKAIRTTTRTAMSCRGNGGLQ